MTSTILTKSDSGGTIVVTYHDRRGLLEFRRGGRKIDSVFVEKHLSRSEAAQSAIRILSE